MKKLAIGFGGHPLTAQQALFLQTGLTEAVTNLIKGLGGDFLIVHGVEITYPDATHIAWSAGWVYFSGEFFEVDAGSIVIASGYGLTKGYFVADETYDPVGNIAYKDLTTQHTQVIRKAKIVASAGGTSDVSDPLFIRSAKRLKNFETTVSLAATTPWIQTTATVGLALGGAVVFTGFMRHPSYVAGETTICTLPTLYRPAEKRVLSVAIDINTVGRTVVCVDINTNGTIVLDVPASAVGHYVDIYLDGLQFIRRTLVNN